MCEKNLILLVVLILKYWNHLIFQILQLCFIFFNEGWKQELVDSIPKTGFLSSQYLGIYSPVMFKADYKSLVVKKISLICSNLPFKQSNIQEQAGKTP